MFNTIQFLQVLPDARILYNAKYSGLWVAVSVFIAIFASYTALTASNRIKNANGESLKLVWLIVSGFALGLGTWAMHFIGMLALRLPCGITYDPTVTMISIIPAILTGNIVFGYYWHHKIKQLPTIINSILLAGGIGTMHFTGMAAMRLDGVVRYDPMLFTLSIVVAVALTYLALRIKNSNAYFKQHRRILTAIALGCAISGMHYIAMASTYFVRGVVNTSHIPAFTPSTLAIIVTITTIFIFFLAIYIASISRARDEAEAVRFRYMFETSPIAVRIAKASDHRVIFANKRYCELINIDSIDVIGTDPVSYYSQPSEYENILGKIYTGSQVLDQLVELTIPNQGKKWALATYMMISYEGEAAVLGWYYDITDSKRVELALKENEERLALATTSNGVGIWDWNLQTLEMVWDDSMFSLYHMQRADFTGAVDAWEKSLHPDDRERSEQEVQDAITGKKPFDTEFRVIWPNGEVHYIKAVAKVFRDENGKPLRMLGIAHDITEQRDTENSLRIAAAAFESQEGMVVTDANCVILRINHAFTRITGYSTEDAIGQTPRLLKSSHHEADFYISMWQQIANTGAYEGEVWNCRKNGELYPVQLNITAVKDDAENVTNYVGAFTDITSRKATEARVGFLANNDQLTGLPNRELFYDRLSQAISQARRKNEGIALLFLDLDGFKPVNDAYGHEAGDVVLRVVAKRLQACVRNMDTVARMGGDEFAIILSALQNSLDAQVIAQKIIANIAEVIQLNATTTCVIGISIGITIYPDNGTEIDVLMNAADSAMYDSKAAGKNTYTLSSMQNQEYSNTTWINLEEIPRVGVAIIDEQHLSIVSMLNAMNNAIKHKESIERLSQLLDELISFTDYHFKTEERLMYEYGYLDEIKHKNTHEHLLHEVTYLRTQFMQGGELVFLQKLKDWFTIHITSSDMPLADFILQQNV